LQEVIGGPPEILWGIAKGNHHPKGLKYSGVLPIPRLTMAIGSHKWPIGKVGEARNRNSPQGKDRRTKYTPRKG
jgi:hypothetical protein